MLSGSFPILTRSQTLGEHGIERSQVVYPSQSFSRLDLSRSSPEVRSRASTLQSMASSESVTPVTSNFQRRDMHSVQIGDIFENSSSGAELTTSQTHGTSWDTSQDVPCACDELPIELISLTDRYDAHNLSANTTYARR